MKDALEFMMIFRYEPQPNYQPTPEEIRSQTESWGKFIGGLAVQGKLVHTYQLGFDSRQIAADHSVVEGYPTVNGQAISGNMTVKAGNMDEAVAMAQESPILKMGGSVEVRSINKM